MDNSTNKFLMSPADIQICQVIHTISKHTTIKNYFFFFNTTRFWRADEKTLEWSHLRLHQIWYELFSSSLNDFRQLAPQNQITSICDCQRKEHLNSHFLLTATMVSAVNTSPLVGQLIFDWRDVRASILATPLLMKAECLIHI